MPKRSSADPAKVAAAVKACDPSLPASRRISQRAAAKRYGVPLGTLKSRIRRAQAEGADASTQGGADASEVADASTPNQTSERRTVPDSITPDARLSGQQWKAATLTVAADMTAAEIAEAVGVSRSTIFEWRKDPVFVSVCDELRGAARVRALETVARAGEEAAHLARHSNRLLGRLMRDAERILDMAEAGEPVDAGQVKAAKSMILALADKVPKGAVPMLDRGGFPKTARVEVDHTVAADGADHTDDDLQRELEALEPELRVLEGGRP